METTMRKINRFLVGAAAAAALSVGVVGCAGYDTTRAPDFAMQPKADMAMNMGNQDMATQQQPDMGCYPNPMTHIEIINACTDSMQIDKPTNPNLPFTDAGTLPPLP